MIRTEGTSMSLIQVQQLSRHPTDYGAEILVQVMISMMMISVVFRTMISMMISLTLISRMT